MRQTVLGISAFYHDSAAALVRDGEILAAAQEERFTRVRHDSRFPRQAINYCLEEAFIEPSELDAVVFYDSPVLTLDRVVRNCLHHGSAGLEQFQQAASSVLGAKVFVEDHVVQALNFVGRAGRVLYTEHHFAHAASAFYPSPFNEAAIVTLDGVGEWTTTAIGHGASAELRLVEEIHFPHSIGLLYAAFTSFCGFKVNSDEYKLMGLAAYGQPTYAAEIRDKLIDVRDDGSFRLNLEYFAFQTTEAMTNERFHTLFGGPPRVSEGRITRREADLAASIQKVTTEVVLGITRRARALTGSRNVTLAGGVALNCVTMGELVGSGIFDRVWVQPAAGDAGGALGAALLVSHSLLGAPRERGSGDGVGDRQRGSYLGPSFSSKEVGAYLDRNSCSYVRETDPDVRAGLVADALSDGNVVGYFSGRMEFGPRALGARSILGDPRSVQMQSNINYKIKFRESFRPFAPAVLAEDAKTYFDLDVESPYMLLTAQVCEERCLPVDAKWFRGEGDDLLELLHQPRSDITAVTHVDYSARVQTVTSAGNPEFHRLLRAFKARTGIGVLVNTSFNVRDEPIVCSPKDAYACFMKTGIDLLVLEDFILWKADQPAWKVAIKQNDGVPHGPATTPDEAQLSRFYTQAALTAAARVQRRGKALLVTAPHPVASSYWVARPSDKRRLVDFEELGARGPDELEARLRRLWSTSGYAELCDLAPALARLSAELRHTENGRDTPVSGLVYVMF